jgi:hypothetical protein
MEAIVPVCLRCYGEERQSLEIMAEGTMSNTAIRFGNFFPLWAMPFCGPPTSSEDASEYMKHFVVDELPRRVTMA